MEILYIVSGVVVLLVVGILVYVFFGPQVCSKDSDCKNDDWYCNKNKRCEKYAKCSSDSECKKQSSKTPLCNSGTCVECKKEKDCLKDHVCTKNECIAKLKNHETPRILGAHVNHKTS